MNFNQLTLEAAREIVARWKTPREAQNLAFLGGDHWQKGEGWIGPNPEDGDPSALSTFRTELEREFCFHDVLGEIVWRAAKAVTARPPRYGSRLARVLKDDEKPSAEEETALGKLDGEALHWAESETRFVWTDEKGRMQTGGLKPFLFRLAAQLASSQRAVLRLFVPPDEAPEIERQVETIHIDATTGIADVRVATVRERVLPLLPAFNSWVRVHVELCPLESACVEVSRDAMAPVGVVLWSKDGNDFAETSFVDEGGQTILRQVGAGLDVQTGFDLQGQLLHLQLCCEPLLKPSLVAQQKDINRRLTMSGRSSNLAGFPERVLLDAELDTEEVIDPRTGEKKTVPKPSPVGPGTLNNYKGELIEGTDGEYLGHKDAKFMRLDPIDTGTFDQSIAAARARMLGEAHQAHALIAGDATASGVSRQQAAHEFRLSIQEIGDCLTRALLWLFSTSFALAVETSDGALNFEAFAWTSEVVVDDGIRTGEDRARDASDVKDGLLSRETAMARGGIDDIDAENGRISGERTPATAFQAGSTEERAALSKALREDGVDDATRWREVWGFDEKQIKAMGEAKNVALFGDGH